MRTLIVIFVSVALLLSCSDFSPGNNKIASVDTLIINERCAVFYYPDPLALETLRKESPGETFSNAVESNRFFMNKALTYVDFKQLKNKNATGNKFLRFIYTDKTDSIINIDELLLPWGVFFFDQYKRPKNIDITIIDLEYQNYFK